MYYEDSTSYKIGKAALYVFALVVKAFLYGFIALGGFLLALAKASK